MQISLTCPNPACDEDLVFTPEPQRGARLQTRCGGCGQAWALGGGHLRRLGGAWRSPGRPVTTIGLPVGFNTTRWRAAG